MSDKALSSIALILTLFGSQLPAAADPLPADSAAVVQALFAHPPQQLKQLEAIIGNLNRDFRQPKDEFGPLVREAPSPLFLRVRAELMNSFYHHGPEETADPPLFTWRLEFVAGRAECRRLLTAATTPQNLELDGRPIYRFGDLYFQELPAADDAFVLSWYREKPLFAILERSAEETARLLASLAAVAREQFSRAAVEKYFGKLQPMPGTNSGKIHGPTYEIEYTSLNEEHPWGFQMVFRRPAPAEILVKELGLRQPVVIAPDVHMQSRMVAERLDSESAERAFREEREGVPGGIRSYSVALFVAPQGLREIAVEYGSWWSIEGAQLLSVSASRSPKGASQPLTFPVEYIENAPEP